MDSELPAAGPAASQPGTWMRLELLGHRVRMGLVTEVEKFGAKMAQIDMFRTGDTAPCLTEYYAAGAFYAIGGTTQEQARTWADHSWDIRNHLPAALLPAPTDSGWSPHDIEYDNDGEVV